MARTMEVRVLRQVFGLGATYSPPLPSHDIGQCLVMDFAPHTAAGQLQNLTGFP